MKKGFTLVETLVAISILLIAIAGPLTIAAKGLSTSFYARDQVTAFYLAQEGIEYIRNIRDTYGIDSAVDSTGWFDGGISPGVMDACRTDRGATFCRIDVTTGVISACAASESNDSEGTKCKPLELTNTGVGVYGYSGGTPSIYTRDISISPVAGANGDAFRISVTVSWRSPLPNHKFTLVEDIMNWQK
jgi:prepilin-type N-terminal cleavage/methylation domain-containing protein